MDGYESLVGEIVRERERKQLHVLKLVALDCLAVRLWNVGKCNGHLRTCLTSHILVYVLGGDDVLDSWVD